MELRGLKYIFLPIHIDKDIYIRKRLLHKGYTILKATNFIDPATHQNEIVFDLIVHVNTLTQAETFLRNEYGINCKL